MKKIFKLLIFTVMLKVWWQEPVGPVNSIWRSGIYMNAATPTSILVLDCDYNEFQWIMRGKIIKKEWVEVGVDK